MILNIIKCIVMITNILYFHSINNNSKIYLRDFRVPNKSYLYLRHFTNMPDLYLHNYTIYPFDNFYYNI